MSRLRIRSLLSSHPSRVSVLASRGRGRRFVAKLLSGPDTALRDALRPEAADLAALRHPSLAEFDHFGHDDESGRPYVARSYVAGVDLGAKLRTGAIGRDLVWLEMAAESLRVLHGFGVLHRNVKASNLIVPRRSPKRGRPGIVLCDPAWWPEDREAAGGDCLAPELRRGEAATFGSDLYALGVVFYRLLTGREFVVSGGGFPDPPRSHVPELPIDLERLVMRLVSPDASKRYQDARDVVTDLRSLSGRSATVESPATAECSVGRSEKIESFARRIESSDRSVGIAIEGVAGSGKTSLLTRFAITAQLLGYDTSYVSCATRTASPALISILGAVVPSARVGAAQRARVRAVLRQVDLDGTPEATVSTRQSVAWELTEITLAALKLRRGVVFVDDVDAADSLSIAVLSSVVRELARHADDGSGSHLVFAYRREESFRRQTEQLTRSLRAVGGPGAIVTADALDPEAVAEWLGWVFDSDPDARVSVAREFPRGGHPAAIQGAIRRGVHGVALSGIEDVLASPDGPSLDPTARRLLDVAVALSRPAPVELFSRVLEQPASRVRSMVDDLRTRAILRESDEVVDLATEAFRGQWKKARISERSGAAASSAHGRIARCLDHDDEDFPGEAAIHWLRSDTPERGVDAALAAARSLVRRNDDKRALDLYSELLGALSDGDPRRRAAERETADAFARIGQHRRSAEIYERFVATCETDSERGELLARLGASCHRSGDVALAISYLGRALDVLGDRSDGDGFHERLRVWSELAEIHNNRGEYDEAERFCRLGTRTINEREPDAPDAPDARTHRARMVLLETLAHVSLRRFRFDEARELFEESLRVSEELGVQSERSLILNNLGILHNQENRFRRAIECYEEAELLSVRLGDDLVLANIYSNLAILYAKTSQLEQADEALRRAARHDEAGESTRTRCFRHHAAGLVDIYAGRYTSAIESLKVAITIAEELKDRFVVAFDLVYLAECHLYRGEIPAAHAALERVDGLDEVSDAIRSMVCARRATLFALAGRADDAQRAVESYREPTKPIPFLRAWDSLFLGWASRLSEREDASTRELDASRRFFARTGVTCGEILAELELAALDIDRSLAARALRRIRKLKSHGRPGRGALRNGALSARLLVYEARALVRDESASADETTQLLVEAESYLIGRHASDLEELARGLRRTLRERDPDSSLIAYLPPPGAPSRREQDLYRSFREAARELASRLKRAEGDAVPAPPADAPTDSIESSVREFEEQLARIQRSVEGRPDVLATGARVSAIRGESEVTVSLRRWIERVSLSDLPVLVIGETGTGKELVARAIHGESARSDRPFVALNCSAVPTDLLESELFGVREGAFTGAEERKDGLLASADGGTFFFDEIGEMSPHVQVKLLRLLDRGTIRPVGATEEIRIDLRFVFATHRDLGALVKTGAIREDFFFRVRGLEIEVPPLRERLDDLGMLVGSFRSECGNPEKLPRFESTALAVLTTYPWPGNVRELKNVVQNLVLTSTSSIQPSDVRRVLGDRPDDGLFSAALLRSRPLPQLVAQLEKEYLVRLHSDCEGDMSEVARRLGISLQALYARLKARGLRAKELRARLRS